MLKIMYLDPPKKWLIYEISPYLGTFFQFEQGYLEVCFFDMLISADFCQICPGVHFLDNGMEWPVASGRFPSKQWMDFYMRPEVTP
jgi:hypothetical protein